ncbi:MAG: hypothetical protein IBJ09_00930 [Bacteroidia bacterium]|nr:hypothetical protein [Bacteroidia bacterium]
MPETIAEILSLSALFLSGLFAYRRMGRFFRIVYAQGLVWIAFYLLLFFLGRYCSEDGQPFQNQRLLNIHMLLECSLLMWASLSRLKALWQKSLVPALFLIFLCIYLLQGITGGFGSYLNYADVSECIALTLLYSMVLYNLLHQRRQHPGETLPGLLLCSGLLLYFAGSVPYIALLHYMEKYSPGYNALLFDAISNGLAFIRYTLCALAFWQLRRSPLTLKT